MVLTLYIVIAWFVVTCFITILPKSNLIKNINLYMLLIIFMISTFTILSMNLGFIEFTKSKLKFIAVALSRDVITPLTIIIFCNIYSELKTYIKKLASIFIVLLLLMLLELINLHFVLHSYVKWNFTFCMIFYCFSILIAIILDKGLLRLAQRGELNKQ